MADTNRTDQTIGYSPDPPPERPDATVGYESADVAAAVNPSKSGGGSKLFSNPGSRPGSLPGKSVTTAAGTRVAPEALIGPYEVLDELGKGGMGVVYKARHIHLNRVVALKMILGGAHLNQAHLDRFRTEAEAVAKLNHPNIVQVYDVGEHNGSPYLALELVEGGNLAQKIAGKPQNPRFAAQTAETIARGIQLAHENHVVHRDLKPANVLLTLDGQPKVTDFGLAKDLAQGQEGQTHAGSILGTPSYMAPEQAAGRIHDIGPATDVYALGAILYELLTGHPPFRGDSPIHTIRMVLDGEVVPPRTLLPHLPRDLDTIVVKALQKPPHRRYASAADFAEDLRRFLDGEPISARPIGPAERCVKWVRRRPATAAMIGTGVLSAVAIIALGAYSYAAVTRRAKEAEEAKQRATEALDEGTRRLVRLNVANGTRMLDDQDYLGSVLWFAEALRLEPGGPAREHVHRVRLQAVLDKCPRPAAVWLHDGAMTDARYDATGTRAITGSDDGTARVWDTKTGQPVGPPLEHGGAVKLAVLTQDGTTAATAGVDGVVRVWDAATGKARFASGLGVQYTGLAFSPDGKSLAASGAAGRVRVWNVATGEVVSTISAGAFNNRACGLCFSPDGTKYFVGSNDGTARLFDAATSAPAGPALKAGGPVLAVAYSPDGKRVAAAAGDGTATIWTLDGQPVLPAPVRHDAAVLAVLFTPDGKRLITASEDRTAQVWDVATGLPVGRSATHASRVHLLDVSPGGRWYVTGSDDNTVRVWDAATGEPASPTFRYSATPVSAKFSPDGYHVLVAAQNRLTEVWNLIAPAVEVGRTVITNPSAATGTNPTAAADEVKTVPSPDGTRLVSFGGGQPVRVRRASDRESVTQPLRTGAKVSAVAFSPDGSRLATGDAEGAIQVWDSAAGRALWPVPGKHASGVADLAFSPDGTKLVSSSEDNTARVWDAGTGEPSVPPVRVGATAVRVEFSAKSDSFYTATATGVARVWDAGTGEPLTPPMPPREDWATLLHPSDWSAEDLLSLGRLLAGQKLSAAGDVLPLDPADLREEWRALAAKHPKAVGPGRAASPAWRKAQAAASEQAGQWFAAAWHLDRLLEETPDDPGLRNRRGAAAAALGDWARAATDADKAVRAQPENADHWYRRGIARGQLGRWDEAAADFAKSVELKADPGPRAELAARVALLAGDRDGYRKACRDAADPDRNTKDPRAARSAAWACSLGDSGVDSARVVALAETGRGGVAGDVAYAAAVFRAGRAADAAAVLEKVCAAAGDRPAAWALYALVLGKTGADGSAWRKRAEAWNPAGAGWDERADVTILLREK